MPRDKTAADLKLVSDAAAFCLDAGMLNEWRKFMEANESAFEEEQGEFKLEHTEIHHKFVDLVDAKLSDWLGARGTTTLEFQQVCASLSSEDNFVGTFIQLMSMALDFQPFADVMRSKQKREYFFSVLKAWRSTLDAANR